MQDTAPHSGTGLDKSISQEEGCNHCVKGLFYYRPKLHPHIQSSLVLPVEEPKLLIAEAFFTSAR